MAEPKKRLTSSRSGSRQSHDAITLQNLRYCSHCKSKIVPHRVCPTCGYYKGKKMIELKDEKVKSKELTKELAEEAEEHKNE
jgi:large subunit ribosomal protein L32